MEKRIIIEIIKEIEDPERYKIYRRELVNYISPGALRALDDWARVHRNNAV